MKMQDNPFPMSATCSRPGNAVSPPFANIHTHGQPTLTDLMLWSIGRRVRSVPRPPSSDLSPAQPDLRRIHSPNRSSLVTWIGHSTLLIQMAGLSILTDPHFSTYASPVPGIGPRRWQAPGLGVNDLPAIDFVLISHNHYDHLDLASVRTLARRKPAPLFVVPSGLEQWFSRHIPGSKTVAMHWNQTVCPPNLDIVFVPVQHWSKRGVWDMNTSLWGGFVLVSDAERFFFAGDLGYSPACAEIGRRFGPFDLAAIPIGAYAPRWFMHNQHIDPWEAVQVHTDVRAKRSLGIHWGTFHGITDEPLDQPPRDLEAAKRKAGLSDDAFFVVRHGQSVDIKIRKA